jgi:multicomponent Na+:H+ antiporter subunit E
LVRLAGVFAGQLLIANMKLARDTLQPQRVYPGVVRVPIENRSDSIIAVLACIVTLTPGTIAIGVDENGALLVHAVNVRNPDSVIDGVLDFDRRLAEVFS